MNWMRILAAATVVSVCLSPNSNIYGAPVRFVSTPQETDPAVLRFVGPDSDIVAIVRPSAILKSLPASLSKQVDNMLPAQMFDIEKLAGVGLDKIDQLTICQTAPQPGVKNRHFYLVIKTREDNDGFNQMIKDVSSASSEFKGDEIHEIRRGRFRFVHFADAQTSVWAQTREHIEFALSVSNDAVKRAKWHAAWKTYASKNVIAAVNETVLTGISEQWFAEGQSPLPFKTSQEIFKASFAIIGFQLGDTAKLSGSVEYPSSESAQDSKEKLIAWVSFAEFMLSQVKEQGNQSDMAIDISKKALSNLKIDARDKMVTAQTQIKLETKLITEFLTSMSAAQSRTKAMNQSRQVGLALHNYLDANGHFPPPVILGENGTLHSWRIAVLPYIAEIEMYRQYRFNEPWDSQHNMRVTAKMPDVFRHPDAPKDSTNSSFFIITGEGTMFSGTEGTKVRSILDGLSATMMMVEAKRDTHWAQPTDITLDEALKPNGLGGYSQNGFIATFADGSTRFIDQSLDNEMLRKMFTIDGGEVLQKNDDDR